MIGQLVTRFSEANSSASNDVVLDPVQATVRKYLEELERMRSQLYESQAVANQLRKEMTKWKNQVSFLSHFFILIFVCFFIIFLFGLFLVFYFYFWESDAVCGEVSLISDPHMNNHKFSRRALLRHILRTDIKGNFFRVMFRLSGVSKNKICQKVVVQNVRIIVKADSSSELP